MKRNDIWEKPKKEQTFQFLMNVNEEDDDDRKEKKLLKSEKREEKVKIEHEA